MAGMIQNIAMRIIGGRFRGRRINAPLGRETTRPMTDRVRQSLFDRLVSMQMLGGHVLDLFAGTGSLGLEALSRGAEHCTFVERDAAARNILEQNIESLGLAPSTSVVAADAWRAAWIDRLKTEPVRLVYCDPPYQATRDPHEAARVARLIEALAPVMEADGHLVLRTEVKTAPPPATPPWQGPDTHPYGSTALHFYHLGIIGPPSRPDDAGLDQQTDSGCNRQV